MEKRKINTTLLYLLLILAGLLAGWLLFGSNTGDHKDHEKAEDTSVTHADVEYTCSMHPQVRQDEPGDCPICGMELIPASDGDEQLQDDPFFVNIRESYSNWANMQTQSVKRTNLAASLRLNGKVVVNEMEQRVITAHFPGRIEVLFANYTGRYIRKGEKLATLYAPEIMQAQQELLQASAEKEKHVRLYQAARQRLKLFNLTEDQIDQIETNKQPSATTDIYATHSGFLTKMAVSEGDYVTTGQLLFAIAGLSTVWVELDAYENQIGLIQQGAMAKVEVPAHQEHEFTGRVEFIDPFINSLTRSTRVRLSVKNKNNLLKPGMLVNAYLVSDHTEQKQLVIPLTAVLWTGKRSVVYVKKSMDNGFTFEFREIETGARTEQYYQVISGLKEGEEIAVNGVFAIDAAAQLQGQYSMMAPPAKTDIPDAFKEKLKNLFYRYFDLKNALADDEPSQALAYGKQLLQQLEATGQHALDGPHHAFWMTIYEEVEESLHHYNQSTDIKDLRIHFEPLSEAFIKTARTLGAIGETWYVAFCPMVDDNRGAYWLSEFEQIKNPYFGSMMLRCGEVKETLRAGIAGSQRDEPREMDEHVH